MLARNFTARETAALTELAEKRIWKELEQSVIEVASPPRLPFAALLYLRWLKLAEVELAPKFRAQVYQRIVGALATQPPPESILVAELLTLQLAPLVREMQQRVDRFERWKSRLVTDPGVMGGETVFPNSRLTVRHVGMMLERGESPNVILEDYPYLSDKDLEFARTYVRAYPRVGRPATRQATG